MLDIISANPYRVLGVYSNSPMKERVANLSKITAFLKVGKPVSFPTDMPQILPEIERTNDSVADANSKLALPAGQFLYAQFWFIKATTFDDIALNNLIAGDVEKALSIWKKRKDASSLQNRIVCNLLLEQNPTIEDLFSFSEVIACAETLYSTYKDDFLKAVLGNNPSIDTKNVEYDFLDYLCKEVGANKILPSVSNEDWKKHISEQAVKPLVDELLNAVSVSKSSKGNGPEARYKAGKKLMKDTKKPLAELEKLTGRADLQYQMVADKVGLEILQCGIDYFNAIKKDSVAPKSMELQSYALSVVVGAMAKDRCKENVDILQNIIDRLPPEAIREEADAIELELQKFYNLPKVISAANTLLNNTKPFLQTIKNKLGSNDSCYLRLSTNVVNNALNNVIQEVNSVQKDNSSGIDEFPFDDGALMQFQKIFNVLIDAWDVTLLMDTFDLEETFKGRYNDNRSILMSICHQYGVSTDTKEEKRIKEKKRKEREEKEKKDKEERERKERERLEREEMERRKHNTGCTILVFFEIITSVLGCAVGPGFFALMCIGGLILYLTLIAPHK